MGAPRPPPQMGWVRREARPRLRPASPPPQWVGSPPPPRGPVGLWGCGLKSLTFHWFYNQNCKIKARQRSRLVSGQGWTQPIGGGVGPAGERRGELESTAAVWPQPMGGRGAGENRGASIYPRLVNGSSVRSFLAEDLASSVVLGLNHCLLDSFNGIRT